MGYGNYSISSFLKSVRRKKDLNLGIDEVHKISMEVIKKYGLEFHHTKDCTKVVRQLFEQNLFKIYILAISSFENFQKSHF